MTSSTSNTAIFAELSPEQRQALFDKLRQRKLTNARRPVTAAAGDQSHQTMQLSPAQALCSTLLSAQNRVLELVVTGPLALDAVESSLHQLGQLHTGLCVRFDADTSSFVAHGQPIPFQCISSGSTDDPLLQLEQARQQLLQSSTREHSLQLICLQPDANTTHLLLATHPLLLDAYSLLWLANQLLALSINSTSLDTLKATDCAAINSYAHWSAQVLEQKFLGQEWNRLKPKSLEEVARNKPLAGADSRHETLFLANDFIQSRLDEGESVKNWMCDALHRCLSSWLSHQEIMYWFNAPQLRDEQFETLLGFHPYFVPVTSAAQEREKDPTQSTQRINRLQTRFSAVSEQLGLELCAKGSNAPMINYHWFDPGADDAGISVSTVIHHQPGFLLSPFEIHITELLSGINVDVHYDPAHIGLDQVNFLLRDLMVYLREEKETEGTSRPSLHERLGQIWKDLLQKNDIGNDQSFFELGGHSLQVTELKFRIKQQLKLDVPISVLYELTTINKLANFILATHSGGLGWTGGNNTASAEEDEEEGVL